MSLLRSIFATSSGGVSDMNNPALCLIDALAGPRTLSGQNVTPDSAMSLSAYYACIRCIAEDVGKLPLIVYRRLPNGGKERATEHPLYKLLHSTPNKEMSSMTLRETITGNALGWGRGISEIVRTNGLQPAAMYPIHPSRVTLKRIDGEIVYEVKPDTAGPLKRHEPYILQSDDVFHLHGVGSNGLDGYSVLRMAAESIGLGIATQKYAAAFLGNGSRVSGVLEYPNQLDDAAYKRLRESWEEQHRGADNAHKVPILEEGAKFTQTTIPPNEAQFLESRMFQIEEIARWFRMPPHKIQHLQRSTNNNIEHQALEYVQDTLMPWLVRWEQEITRKLFTEKDSDYFAEFLVDGLLRGDSAARGEYYAKMTQIGAITPNTIAIRENLPLGGPECDRRYIQGAMVPLEMAGKFQQKPAPKEDAEATTDITTPKKEPKKEASALADAQRKVFMDAANRWTRKEWMAMSRMAKKHGTMPAFRNDLMAFHKEQEEYFVAIFEPICFTLLHVNLKDVAKEVCRDVGNLALSEFANHMINTTEEGIWMSEVPKRIVAKLLNEGTSNVAA